MRSTNLRKVGGSVMLAVPPALLKLLDLGAGGRSILRLKGGRLVVARQNRRRYSLSELLKECDSKAPRRRTEKAWVTEGPTGRELL